MIAKAVVVHKYLCYIPPNIFLLIFHAINYPFFSSARICGKLGQGSMPSFVSGCIQNQLGWLKVSQIIVISRISQIIVKADALGLMNVAKRSIT